MTGKTHRIGGMACCLLGYSILESRGMLIEGVHPLLQLTVMYPFSLYGSTVSDLDHIWENCPSKDIFSFYVNKVLHITTGADSLNKKIPPLGVFDAKHRSWQTHSDWFFFVWLFALYRLLGIGYMGAQEVILMLVLSGMILGVISHMLLDMVTPEGIWNLTFCTLNKIFKLNLPRKIHLVPSKPFFATDGKWESFIRRLLWLFCVLLSLRLIYIMSQYNIVL